MSKAHYNWERFWSPLDALSNDDDGFITDSPEWLRHQGIVPFSELVDSPCLILLGNPGDGKSFALKEIARQLQSQSIAYILKDLREFGDFKSLTESVEDEQLFRKWQEGSDVLQLFLDSLDEGRLVMKRLEHDLQRFLSKLPAERLHLRITCRSAELPDDFINLMSEIWGTDSVKEYVLAPLRVSDVLHAIEVEVQNGSVIDSDEFLKSVYDLNIAPLAAHPVTLNLLFQIYKAEGKLPSSRREIYERGCLALAAEMSSSRADDGFEGEFDAKSRIEAARRIAFVTVLSNSPSVYASVEPNANADLVSISDLVLSDQPRALLEETLKTALFIPIREIRFWAHRSYGEYLAASWITNNHMPLEQIQALLTHPEDIDKRIAHGTKSQHGCAVCSRRSAAMRHMSRPSPGS